MDEVRIRLIALDQAITIAGRGAEVSEVIENAVTIENYLNGEANV